MVTNSKRLIPQEIKWKYVNMNPTATTIKGLIKMHKPEYPIRPVVNWRGAPAYKLARLFTQKIKELAPLPNRHNVHNTRDVIKTLNDTPILPHFNLAPLDVANLYTNILVAETRNTISYTLKENLLDPQNQQELLNWYDVITQQNYFTINDEVLLQRNGLAMGAPTSGLLSEFFLQNLEHLNLAHLSNKYKIVNYLRYVDDILLIFDSNHTNIQNILDDFNAIHPNLKFTAETETKNKINFLDVTIHKTYTNWKISIYRKPTFTDTTIPYTSNHPAQHKYAAIRFLYNRLNTCDLHEDEYKTEESFIQNIMYNNAFPIKPHKPPIPKPPTSELHRKIATTTHTPTHKLVTFTYIGKETNFITNLFRKTNLKIAFRTNNTIQSLLKHQQQLPDTYTQSGVYKLKCPDCNKTYVSQTGRSFQVKFNEHKNSFKTNSHISNFAKHLNEQAHSFESIHNTMQTLQRQNKGSNLNKIERVYIYAEYLNNNNLNDEHTIFHNIIFEALLKPHQP